MKPTEGVYRPNFEVTLIPDPEVDEYQRIDGYHIFKDKDGVRSLWRVQTKFVRVARSDDEQALIEAQEKANQAINTIHEESDDNSSRSGQRR